MTLHGEQEGDEIDWELHEKNRKAWHRWAAGAVSDEQRSEFAGLADITRLELSSIPSRADETHERYTQEMKRRNADTFQVPRMPRPTASIEMQNVNFDRLLCLSNFVIPKEMILSGSKFREQLHVGGAVFVGAFFAENVAFEKGSIFFQSRFLRDAWWAKSSFIGAARFISIGFQGAARFDNTRFWRANGSLHDVANFSKTSFEKIASFRGTYFESATMFEDCNFLGSANFNGRATRLNGADEPAAFAGKTSFKGAHFHTRSDFARRRFGVQDGEAETITFADVIFEGPVSFEDAKFAHVFPGLDNTTFPHSTKVTAKLSHWPKLRPSLLSRIRNLYTRKSKTTSEQKPTEIREAASRLRHVMARQMMPEEEHFFFRYEMGAAAREGGFCERILNLPTYIYGAISEYGHSIARPAILLVVMWGFWAWVYVTCAKFTVTTAMAFSFATIFRFLGFQRTYLDEETKRLEDIPWMELIAASQTVVGFVLLFFLGLGLRTRFRLR
ncbi:pentapeptide repeat-containing protein [Loktanella sp. S4079]|uniref:pentapeptide repeat-containing protein n=1 Tax=Loktanella sp. S4079 TaxID=579483 RepID=UPI0005FA8400|nr:pentapeptide repeat-containing protein [Loktanella sp. S4079]KJZ19592.1 hypothetical protein TW80_01390 [Loktanella sp. S4079]